jgi:hypothetical protein
MVFEIVFALFLQKLHVPITTSSFDLPRLPLQGRSGQGYHWNNGMMEYWNVGMSISNKEFFIFMHSLLASFKKKIFNHPIVPKPIIPPFHSSNIPNVSEAT